MTNTAGGSSAAPDASAAPSSSTTTAENTSTTVRKRKRRWGEKPAAAVSEAAGGAIEQKKAKALALQASIKARLEAARKLKAGGGAQQPPTKKAKVYELNLNETGPSFETTVVSAAKTKTTTTTAQVKKPKINPYLAHRHEEEGQQQDEEDATITDDDSMTLLRVSKPRERRKEFKFVEPGMFTTIAERKRTKAQNAIASGFVSGRKQGEHVQSHDMAEIYGAGAGAAASIEDETDKNVLALRPDCDDKKMPLVMEWWDLELLPNKLKKQVIAKEGEVQLQQTKAKLRQLGGGGDDETMTVVEGQANDETTTLSRDIVDLQTLCWNQASLSYSKTSVLVQHIVPIRTTPADVVPKQPTLYLTKRELKRQRKLRRQEKQREMMDLQAAGLRPAPEPRLTLQNFMKVLGDQAVLDPSQMQQKVRDQMQARQRAHFERNAANALTKEQRSQKLIRKLTEDTSQQVAVALFHVKDMSHPYHRTKVDLNAQQNSITGGVLECSYPSSVSCVIAEGGPKAIKRYTRLMTVRMKWKGLGEEGDDDDDTTKTKFNPENECSLVWTGMAKKRLFKGFVFQSCETSDQCRKVLKTKGVGHYWDQVLSKAKGEDDRFKFKLTTTTTNSEEDGDQMDES